MNDIFKVGDVTRYGSHLYQILKIGKQFYAINFNTQYQKYYNIDDFDDDIFITDIFTI